MKKLLIVFMISALCHHHMQAMQMNDLAKKSKKADKKEHSCPSLCCNAAKMFCGLAAVCYLLTSGQPTQKQQSVIVGPGGVIQGQESLDVTACDSDGNTLELGYAAASWNDLRTARQRTGCKKSSDDKGYEDYYM